MMSMKVHVSSLHAPIIEISICALENKINSKIFDVERPVKSLCAKGSSRAPPPNYRAN